MFSDAPLILNPATVDDRAQARLTALAEKHGIAVHHTSPDRDAGAIVGELLAEGTRRVTLAGGDGTVHGAVNAAMRHDEGDQTGQAGAGEARERDAGGGADRAAGPGLELCIVPCGSANDLATRLGLPAPDAVELLDVAGDADAAEAVGVDVMRLTPLDPDSGRPQGDRAYAINAVSGGFSSDVHERITEEQKAWWRGLTYTRVGIEQAPTHEHYTCRVTLDGDTRVKVARHVVAVVATVSGRAGGYVFNPDSEPGDGRVELVVMCANGLDDWLQLLADGVAGRLRDSGLAAVFSTAGFTLELEPVENDLIVDGERWRPAPIRVDVLPRAVTVFKPRS